MTDADLAIDTTLRELTREAPDDPMRTRHVDIGPDALARVGSWIGPRPALVIGDPNTAIAAGQRLHALLVDAGVAAQLCVLPPHANDEHLTCDDAAIDRLGAILQASPHATPIAVGAGTVNDIVKMAAHRQRLPFACVATAASMNGYTSAIAAVLSRGVKRTLPAAPAQAVFADTDVIAAAPAWLNQAGFGDLLSKPYSHADWLLSHLVRGVAYAERPARLLDAAYDALLDRAQAVREATPDGIGLLTRTIVLSGFTMAIAGTSAPASGGEHLVSHYWDMEQHCHDEPLFGLHGTQVGVATLLSALLFERLVALPTSAIDPDAAATRRRDDGWLATLADQHPRLTAAVIEEVREQITAKQRHGAALRNEIADVRARWDEIRRVMQGVLVPSARIALALRAAGCADRPSAIGIDREHATLTLRVCRQIRNRYVALDLLDDLGLLHDAAAAAVDRVETS